VGAGLSGCAMARLLKDKGHDVLLLEKKAFVGGLCITRVDRDGIKFEPFGARTFHSKNPRVIDFVTRFDEFNDYVHRKGMIINQRLLPFPISTKSLSRFVEHDQIVTELSNRPAKVDDRNFETACISIFGLTLYRYFVENYTRTMWGIEPRELTADWAPKRLEFREDDNDELFRGQWQGLPRKGYSYLLENMVKDIPIKFSTTEYTAVDYDVVVCSAPIDAVLGYKYGRLPYRSIRFHYQYDEHWENERYGTINLPQDPRFIRKCNFKILHQQECSLNRVQYQEPIAAVNGNMPMYPINTRENDALFDRYLEAICGTDNICPLGRLGLFKYLDMDKAVEVAFDMVDVVETYRTMTVDERYSQIREIRRRY
jgi:UDP-galactopyranose mutase